jgi:hypothetical protein
LHNVKYLKSNAQVLLDRAITPDNLWFLAQDCLSHVYNLTENCQLNWKIPEQVSQTSAARFHLHISEFLLRLGFKKTKPAPELWMMNKSSHYECLATYVDDILIWSMDRLQS